MTVSFTLTSYNIQAKGDSVIYLLLVLCITICPDSEKHASTFWNASETPSQLRSTSCYTLAFNKHKLT